MIEKDTISGSFPVQFWVDITESQKVTDAVDNRSSVNVAVTLRTLSPDHEFTTREILTADDSIISEVSKANYPLNTTEIIPRTIGRLIEQETETLRDFQQKRDNTISRRAKIRTRISIGLGLLTGGTATATGILISDNQYERALTGGLSLTGIFGVLALCSAVVDFGEPKTPETSSKIDNAKDRLAMLELIQAASRNLKIKNLEEIEQTPEE